MKATASEAQRVCKVIDGPVMESDVEVLEAFIKERLPNVAQELGLSAPSARNRDPKEDERWASTS